MTTPDKRQVSITVCERKTDLIQRIDKIIRFVEYSNGSSIVADAPVAGRLLPLPEEVKRRARKPDCARRKRNLERRRRQRPVRDADPAPDAAETKRRSMVRVMTRMIDSLQTKQSGKKKKKLNATIARLSRPKSVVEPEPAKGRVMTQMEVRNSVRRLFDERAGRETVEDKPSPPGSPRHVSAESGELRDGDTRFHTTKTEQERSTMRLSEPSQGKRKKQKKRNRQDKSAVDIRASVERLTKPKWREEPKCEESQRGPLCVTREDRNDVFNTLRYALHQSISADDLGLESGGEEDEITEISNDESFGGGEEEDDDDETGGILSANEEEDVNVLGMDEEEEDANVLGMDEEEENMVIFRMNEEEEDVA